MNSKKWIGIFVLVSFIGVGFVGLVNYVVDPYGLKSNKNKFVNNLVITSNPIITSLKINLNADYYLIGTSRVIRINPILIENYLIDKKVFNINISGATFKENQMLVNKVNKNNSNFIYGFDAFSLNKNLHAEKRFKIYENELKNNFYYLNYLNSDFFTTSIYHILQKILNVNLDKVLIYENKKNFITTFKGIEEHLNLSNNGSKKSSYSDFKTVKDYKILELANQATKDDIFIIYPKHFYHYILFQKYQNIEEKYFHAIKLLVKNTNAKVWSFYGINEITLNDKNFDENGWHFKPKIADLIFARIFEDKNVEVPKDFGVLVTKENIDQHLNNLKQQIKNYDLNKTLKTIK